MTPDGEREVLDRSRRIETRLVKVMEYLGLSSNRQLPEFVAAQGVVNLPSIDTSLHDILNAIPDGHDKFVTIWHKEHRLGMILKGDK